MTTPKLSICIATLNRAAFLGETLDSIIAQATDEVEIIVVDGASTDNTEELVRGYQQRFPRLNYLRLEAKGGVDKDYCRTVELAQGEYCWLMSDDDLLKPGAIQAILEATQRDYPLIIVNSEVRNINVSKLVVPARLPFITDQVYGPTDNQRLFIDTAYYISFIGCVVVRRQLWNERQKEQYIGTEFVHIGVIFQSPFNGDVLVIARPWITIRYGNASWSSRYFSIWMFKFPQLIWSFADYSEAAKQQAYPREPWRKMKILLVNRATGVYTPKEYSDLVKPRLKASAERLGAWVIAYTPACLINLVVLVYFILFKPQFRLALEDFRNSRFYFINCLQRIFKGFARVF